MICPLVDSLTFWILNLYKGETTILLSGGGNGNPFQGLLPGESLGQRSLVGYSTWGHTESDMTE